MDEQKRRRQQRREIRLLQRESTWLQKALFAMGKVQEVREKLADTRGADVPEPYNVRLDGNEVPLEALEDAIQARAQELLEEVRKRRQAL